jgi:hypothetical protein
MNYHNHKMFNFCFLSLCTISIIDAKCYLPILPVLSEPDAIYMMVRLHRTLSPELQLQFQTALLKNVEDTPQKEG